MATQLMGQVKPQMPPTIEEKKTEEKDESVESTPTKDINKARDDSLEDTPPKQQGLIKARGTYYPLTAFPTSMPQGAVMRKEAEEEVSPGKSDSSNTHLSNSGKSSRE